MESATLREDLGIPALNTFTLSYVDTKIGTGPLAVKHKWYSLKYTGYLTDGTVFDASSKHPDHDPFVFQQGPSPQGRRQVIVGWDTGIDGMRIGGKRRLFIPNELAYGPNGNPAGGIPPKSWLIFDIELVAQNDTDPSPKVITPLPTPAGTTTAPSTGAGTGAAPTPNKVSAAPTVAPKPVQAPTPTQAPAAPTPPAPKP